MDLDVTESLYCGYDRETELSTNGCIFQAADHLRLVSPGETGFGWSKAEICDLTDQIRVSIECDSSVLDTLSKDVRDKLLEGLNLSLA